MANMNNQDLENLASWLQAILKEVQETRGATLEMRDKTNLIPEIRNFVSKETGGQGQLDHRIDESRNHLEAKINNLEQRINDMRNMLNDIKSKVDRIKT